MSADAAVSFAADIKPLFREGDRDAMIRDFDLWNHADVVEHASAIAERLRDGSMPCDVAWPADRVELFASWIEGGMAP